MRKNNTSKTKNVYYDTHSGRWRYDKTLNKILHRGIFKTKEEAIAYKIKYETENNILNEGATKSKTVGEDEDTCKSCNESVGEKNICDRCNECCDPSRPSRCCECEDENEKQNIEEMDAEEEEEKARQKIWDSGNTVCIGCGGIACRLLRNEEIGWNVCKNCLAFVEDEESPSPPDY